MSARPWARASESGVSPWGSREALPSNWTVKLYQSLQDIPRRYTSLIRGANLVILGSYVPDGIAIAEWVTAHVQGVTAFYDIDTPVTLAGLDQGLEYLSAAMIPLQDQITSRSRSALHLVLSAVGLLLLIGCVNVANLLLARFTGQAAPTLTGLPQPHIPAPLALANLSANCPSAHRFQVPSAPRTGNC